MIIMPCLFAVMIQIAINVVYACFEFYDEDEETEWVQYVCKRWLHEDCYTEVVVDKYG